MLHLGAVGMNIIILGGANVLPDVVLVRCSWNRRRETIQQTGDVNALLSSFPFVAASMTRAFITYVRGFQII